MDIHGCRYLQRRWISTEKSISTQLNNRVDNKRKIEDFQISLHDRLLVRPDRGGVVTWLQKQDGLIAR